MLKFIIADDHPVIRTGLTQILSAAFSSAFIKAVPDAASLLKLVLSEHWDIVISDIAMPGMSGLELLDEIRKQRPQLPVLILSIYAEEIYAVRVLKAGAWGFMNKDFSPEQLILAVERLLSGKKYISEEVADRLAAMVDENQKKTAGGILSGRELEVLKYIGSGLAIGEIASRLSLGVSSVSTYRSRILAKLNLRTTSDLIHFSMENGLT